MAFFLRYADHPPLPPSPPSTPRLPQKLHTHYRYLCAVYILDERPSTYLRATKNFQLAIKRFEPSPTIAAAFPTLHRKHPERSRTRHRFRTDPLSIYLSFHRSSLLPTPSPRLAPLPFTFTTIYVIELEPSNTDRADPAEFGSRSTRPSGSTEEHSASRVGRYSSWLHAARMPHSPLRSPPSPPPRSPSAAGRRGGDG